MPSALRRAMPLVAVLALVPTSAASAQAPATADVASGQTMLRLDRGTAAALASNGVRVSLVRPARTGASGLTFPVSGGRIDPANLLGSVEHRGGIRFRAGGRTVVLRNPVYRLGARGATLSASVGGARLPVATLSLAGARASAPDALTKTASGIRASLTTTAARALNRAFSTSLFRGGLRLGTVRTEIVLGDAVFAGGATTLSLDPGAGAALQSLCIAPGVLAPATAGAEGLRFPITGGRVDARTLAGTIAHSGGISLTQGATVVELRDFAIGIDGSPALSAVVGGQRLDILTLDVANIRRSVTGRVVTVSNVVARLTGPAAAALNQAFGTTAFAEGLVLGTATVEGRTA